MKILLTGSHGFIGTHVRRLLAETPHEVLCFDCLEPRVHGDWAHHEDLVRRRISFVFPEEVADVDVVIHLAAQVGVADSMTDPARYLHGNTMETHSFYWQLARYTKRLKRIVVASSMSVYGDPKTAEPIGEGWPTTPASIYGLTKFDQEILTMTLAPLMGATPVALRFFNVFGPGQALTNPYTGVLANFANAILRGEAPTVYEDGLQTRDFIYVEDVARVVVDAISAPMEGVYNVCTGVPQTILGVAECLCEALNSDVDIHMPGTARPGDIRHCVGRNVRLRNALPLWQPRRFALGLASYAEHLLASAQAPEGRVVHPST